MTIIASAREASGRADANSLTTSEENCAADCELAGLPWKRRLSHSGVAAARRARAPSLPSFLASASAREAIVSSDATEAKQTKCGKGAQVNRHDLWRLAK